MKIFALSFGALLIDGNVKKTYSQVGATKNALSKYEAVGKGIEMANENFPQEEGFFNHWCNAVEIPQDWYVNDK